MRSGSNGASVGRLLFGNLAAAASNAETRYGQPKPDLMEEADKVALWLLAQLSVSPQEYLDEIARLDSESSGLAGAAYSTTRGLSRMRRVTIERWIDSWKVDGLLPMPQTYSEAVMQQFKSQAIETGLIAGVKALIAEAQSSK